MGRSRIALLAAAVVALAACSSSAGRAEPVADVTVPEPWSWPSTESYHDIWSFVSQNEFTIHQCMGPSAYVWGYLAARP
jgi:hypothetical protein